MAMSPSSLRSFLSESALRVGGDVVPQDLKHVSLVRGDVLSNMLGESQPNET
jgi:hypothetical protein